ncbi:MAG: hypothetical protein DME46_06925 [Verrucomicrobia bacterium]|nr:MAG: hypothetical protein DME46_06925 [Verrucomicrobiota bacterium]
MPTSRSLDVFAVSFAFCRLSWISRANKTRGLGGSGDAGKGLLAACRASVMRMTLHDKLFAETCVFFHFRGFAERAIYEVKIGHLS